MAFLLPCLFAEMLCLLTGIFQSVKYRINTSALNASPTSFYVCLYSMTIIGPAERDEGLLQIILRTSVCLRLKIEEIRGETAKNRRSNEEPTGWDYRRTQSDIITENVQPDSDHGTNPMRHGQEATMKLEEHENKLEEHEKKLKHMRTN